MNVHMMKKTIGLLAALTLTLTSMGAVTAGAEGYEDPGLPDDAALNAEASSALDDIYSAKFAGDETAEREAVERYSIETEDPMYLRALQQQTDFEMNAGGGNDDAAAEDEPEDISRSLNSSQSYVRYTGKYLDHASRFDGLSKHLVIDVSQWQYTIDWNKVKADGIDYAVIRLGYRGYGNGALVTDPYFYDNINNARKAGIKVGVYFFTQAITQAEAREEARYCIDQLGGMGLQLPIFYDTETEADPSARANDSSITKAQRTKFCSAFCDEVNSYGNGKYTGAIYSYYNYFYYNIDAHTLGKTYPMWLACYDSYTDYDGDYGMWQFTSTAKVDGVSGGVDMSVLYGDSFIVGSAGDDTSAPENPGDSEPDPAPVTTVSLKKTEGVNYDYDSSNGKYTLFWDDVDDAEGYEVYLYNYLTDKYTLVATVDEAACDLTDVKTDKPYVVRAYAGSGSSKSYGAYSDEVYFGDGIIRGLRASLNGSSVSLEWEDEDCDGYYVYRSTDGKNFSRIGDTEDTQYTDSSISTSQSRYFYLVQAYDITSSGSKKTGIRSNPVTVRLAPAKPAAPTFSGCTADSVSVTWTAVEDADGYQVLLYNESTGNYTLKEDVSASSSLKAKISSLTAGTSYKVAIRAYSTSSGSKKFSQISDPLTAKTIPPVISNISSKAGTGGIIMSWTASKGAEQYVIYKKTTAGYTKLGTTKGTSVEIKITGTGDKAYCVTAAVNQGGKLYQSPYSALITANGGSGSGSSTDSGTLTNGIGRPTIKGATYTNGALTLTWTSAANATGYRLYRYDPNAKTYKSVKTLNGSSKTSYTINNFSFTGSDKFKVKAYRRNGSDLKWGTASKVYTVKQSGTVLSAPTGVYTTATPSTISITWKAVSGADSYNVYEIKNNSYKLLGTATKTSYSLKTGAGSGRYFAVAANSGTTVGNVSSTSTVYAPPAAPTLSVAKYTSNSIKLSWTFPSNATGARLYLYNTAKKKYVSLKTLSTKKTAYTIKNLSAGSAYKFKIKAYTKSGTGITWGKASSLFTAYTSN